MLQETEIIKDTTHLGDEGELVINMGPQHPATHGVLHLVVTLNGETIKKIEPHRKNVRELNLPSIYLCYK
jgi:NADH-quinone oxidoreductase subunit D